MKHRVDYHIHTNYSDGSMSPIEIVKKYKQEEYDIIAITDHDTVDGVREAMIAGEALGLPVIAGIEFSTVYNDQTVINEIAGETGDTVTSIEMHLLGYKIDISNDKLTEKLKDIRMKRQDRNDKLFKVLADMGYELTFSEVARDKRGNYIGKPDFGRAMAKRGYISTPDEIFAPGKYLESPEAKAVKKQMIDTEEAISLILEAGGIPVLAHPIQITALGKPGSEQFYDNLDKLLYKLKKEGLKGIECYHPDHNEENVLRFIELAEKYHLHITKGSDYHGTDFVKKQK